MENKKIGVVKCDDERLCYEFVDPNHKVLIRYRCHNDEQLDYIVPLTQEAKRHGHTEPLPISFFSITYGEVEKGKQWYQNKFPKLSDELAYLLSRYNFGDLKYATKKTLETVAKDTKKSIRTKSLLLLRSQIRIIHFCVGSSRVKYLLSKFNNNEYE